MIDSKDNSNTGSTNMRAAPGTAQLGMAEKLGLLQAIIGTKGMNYMCVRLYRHYQQGRRLEE
mgnify:CR=1 FL=1|tara:strand:+ start:255 stop:440 length:186 start_codon:yes stop_codon:yes gene_type:complete